MRLTILTVYLQAYAYASVYADSKVCILNVQTATEVRCKKETLQVRVNYTSFNQNEIPEGHGSKIKLLRTLDYTSK